MKRIMLGGCPRSGTTMVQKAIIDRFELFAFKETHYYRLKNQPRNGKARYKAIKPLIYAKVASKMESNRFFFDLCFQGYTKTLDSLAREGGYNCWIEKTPSNLLYYDVERNQENFDGFVFVYKSPVEVIASLWEKGKTAKGWGNYADLDYVIDTSNRYVGCLKRYSSLPNVQIIMFDDAISHLDQEMNKLKSLFGLEERRSEILFNYVRDNETWKQRSFEKARVIKKLDSLDKPIRDYIELKSDRF